MKILLIWFGFVLAKKAAGKHSGDLVYTGDGYQYIRPVGDHGLIDCPLYKVARDQKVVWRKENELLSDGINTRTLSNGTLSITMRPEHEGSYQCYVINPDTQEQIGSGSEPINIILARLGEHFHEGDYQAVGQPNHEVQLSCSIEGVPKPIITWFKGETENSQKKNKIKDKTNGFQLQHRYNSTSKVATAMLIIPSPNSNHHGNYYCTARLESGEGSSEEKISHMYELEVKEAPNLGRGLTCPKKVTTDDNQMEIVLDNIETKEFNVTWEHNGKTVSDSGRYKIKKMTSKPRRMKTAKLIVTHPRQADSGIYKVTVSIDNPSYVAKSHQCEVEVEDLDNRKLSRPKDQVRQAGESVKIECGGRNNAVYLIKFVPQQKEHNYKVQATIGRISPGPIKLDNDREISFTGKPPSNWALSMNNDLVTTLTITNLTLDNAGNYSCQIKNGETVSSELQVLKRKLISTHLGDIFLKKQVEKQSRVCRASGANQIYWEFIGESNDQIKKVLSTAKKSIKREGIDEIESTIVFDLKPELFHLVMGNYKCVASGSSNDEEHFKVMASSTDIQDQLRNLTIQISRQSADNIYFSAPGCSSYLSHYFVSPGCNCLPLRGANPKCMIECRPGFELVEYSFTKCPETRRFSIIPALTQTKQPATVRNKAPESNFYTISGQTHLDNINPEQHGVAIGIRTFDDLFVPKVTDMTATLKSIDDLEISWSYRRVIPDIHVINFSIRVMFEDQTFQMSESFTGEHYYSTRVDIGRQFPSIKLELMNNDARVRVDVRVYESKLGLSEPQTAFVLLRTESFELLIAFGAGIFAVLMILTIVGFSCFKRRNKKQKTSERESMADKPPGGLGELDGQDRLLKDRYPSTISIIQDDNTDEVCVQSVSSAVNNHSTHYHIAAREQEQEKFYRRRNGSPTKSSRRHHLTHKYEDPYDAETETDYTKSLGGSEFADDDNTFDRLSSLSKEVTFPVTKPMAIVQPSRQFKSERHNDRLYEEKIFLRNENEYY